MCAFGACHIIICVIVWLVRTYCVCASIVGGARGTISVEQRYNTGGMDESCNTLENCTGRRSIQYCKQYQQAIQFW